MPRLTPDQLVDVESIKRLKARYFRCMDAKQWEEMAQVFAEEAWLRWGEGEDQIWRGRDAIVEGFRRVLADATTVHHGHMPEIEIDGPDRAHGIWSMFDYVQSPRFGLEGYGHYTERYVVEDGEWRIAESTLTRLRVDPLEPAG
jgi:uncharacterized protein (TIGR02246 family)